MTIRKGVLSALALGLSVTQAGAQELHGYLRAGDDGRIRSQLDNPRHTSTEVLEGVPIPPQRVRRARTAYGTDYIRWELDDVTITHDPAWWGNPRFAFDGLALTRTWPRWLGQDSVHHPGDTVTMGDQLTINRCARRASLLG